MIDLTVLKNLITLYEAEKLDATGLREFYNALDAAALSIDDEADKTLVNQVERYGLPDSDQETMRKQHSLSREQMGIL